MKKLTTFIALTLLLFTSCNKNNGTTIVAVDAVNIDPIAVTMEENQTVLLKATIAPADAQNKEVTWTSSNTSVVEVDEDGTVTAIAVGESTITATTVDGGHTATCVVTVSAQASRPKLPIEYIAEFNVNTDGDGFATSHDNDQSGYFTWSEAKDLFDGSVSALQGYHLPTKDEWIAVGSTATFIQFGSSTLIGTNNTITEQATVNGVTKSYFSRYKRGPNGSHITYGMRFQGGGTETNELKCAYRYEPVGTFADDGNLTSHLKVTVRYVGPTANVHIDDIATEDYWNTNNHDDVIRIFPAVGHRDKDVARTLRLRGWSGSYSSMDISSQASDGSHVIYRFTVTPETVHVTNNLSTYHGFAVRPFSNE